MRVDVLFPKRASPNLTGIKNNTRAMAGRSDNKPPVMAKSCNVSFPKKGRTKDHPEDRTKSIALGGLIFGMNRRLQLLT